MLPLITGGRSDLGAHVDGYVALVATTVVIGEKEVTGRKADALQAAKVASEAIIRLLQPGKKNSELTPLIEKVRRHGRRRRSSSSSCNLASSPYSCMCGFLMFGMLIAAETNALSVSVDSCSRPHLGRNRTTSFARCLRVPACPIARDCPPALRSAHAEHNAPGPPPPVARYLFGRHAMLWAWDSRALSSERFEFRPVPVFV
jgi:hypothetical protein